MQKYDGPFLFYAILFPFLYHQHKVLVSSGSFSQDPNLNLNLLVLTSHETTKLVEIYYPLYSIFLITD
jgi:hypothetical protein